MNGKAIEKLVGHATHFYAFEERTALRFSCHLPVHSRVLLQTGQGVGMSGCEAKWGFTFWNCSV